nr:p28 [Pistachio virus X]
MNMESYREVSDIVLVVVPQVDDGATITLSLVDTAKPLTPVNGQEIRHAASDGPVLVVFNCSYSIPNADRVTFEGNQRHRRLAIRYEVDCDVVGSGNEVTTFAVTPLWRERHNMRPAYNLVPDPVMISIKVGYKTPLIVKNHRQLKQAIQSGLVTYGHVSEAPMVSGEADITNNNKNLVVDAADVKKHAPMSLASSGSSRPLSLTGSRNGRSRGRSSSPGGSSSSRTGVGNLSVPRPSSLTPPSAPLIVEEVSNSERK